MATSFLPAPYFPRVHSHSRVYNRSSSRGLEPCPWVSYRRWLGMQVGSGEPAEQAGDGPQQTAAIDSEASVPPQGDEAGQRQQQGEEGEETLVQYVVIRKDLTKALGWPVGPVIAQACHASCAALWLSRETAETQRYCAVGALDHMTKVTLEIKNEGQLLKLAQSLEAAGVGHKLWVEEPELTPTALATFPVRRSEVQPLFKKCQLYR